ncbi:MAG: ATP-binding protein [Verrucomicrobiota bacterium]|nr:ATP-binding protein [Verrucomicrobiota bacterium]
MSLSFRLRIALWSALLSGTVLIVFLGFTSNMVRKTMTQEADYELKGFTADMVLTAQAMEEGGLLQTQLVGTLSAERAEVRLIELAEIESPDESTIDRSPLALEDSLIEGNQIYKEPDWPEPGKEIEWKSGGSNETIKYKDKTWRVMCRTFDGYRVRMAIDLKEIRDELSKLMRRYFEALPLALIVIGFGAWWIAGRAVRPVQKIISTAENITAQGLEARVQGVSSKDELGRLAGVLNQMMDRLETSFKQMKRFSADASHELKTPLAVMQGKIEAALQDHEKGTEHDMVLVDILERVGQLRSIIDSLLMLSRSDAGGLIIEKQKLDLCHLMSEIVEDAEVIAAEEGISFQSENGSPDSVVNGDERLLRLAISNLLTNATKYNLSEGGKIASELRSGDGVYQISISNTGPMIPSEIKEKIFERFYRVDSARGPGKSGFGLGLSLARVIALAHGGQLNLSSSEGGINCFVMTLPKEGTK